MDATLLVHKALPTPTLTLHDTLFSSLIIYLILFKINDFPMWYEIWQGRI